MQMQSITNTDVPIGLYNKLMEGLQQEISRAQNSPLFGLYTSLVVKFSGILPDDALAGALSLLDRHNIKTATQLGMAPNVLAQLPAHMHTYLLRKCGLAVADMPGCASRGLVEKADKVLETQDGANAALRKKDYKNFSMVGVFGDMRMPAGGVTLSIPAPEGKGWALSMGRRMKSTNAKRQAVEVACRSLQPDRQKKRLRCIEVLQGCIAALKEDATWRDGKMSPVYTVAVEGIKFLEKLAGSRVADGKSSIKPTHCILLERKKGPFVFRDQKNTDHFASALLEELSKQVGIHKDRLTFVPSTISPAQVDAVLEEVDKSTAAHTAKPSSHEAVAVRSLLEEKLCVNMDRGLLKTAFCFLISVIGILVAIVMLAVLVLAVAAAVLIIPAVGVIWVFYIFLMPVCWVCHKSVDAYKASKQPKEPGYVVTICRTEDTSSSSVPLTPAWPGVV